MVDAFGFPVLDGFRTGFGLKTGFKRIWTDGFGF
jgi:hypothetical protein